MGSWASTASKLKVTSCPTTPTARFQVRRYVARPATTLEASQTTMLKSRPLSLVGMMPRSLKKPPTSS